MEMRVLCTNSTYKWRQQSREERPPTTDRQGRWKSKLVVLLPGDTLQAILSDRRTFLYKRWLLMDKKHADSSHSTDCMVMEGQLSWASCMDACLKRDHRNVQQENPMQEFSQQVVCPCQNWNRESHLACVVQEEAFQDFQMSMKNSIEEVCLNADDDADLVPCLLSHDHAPFLSLIHHLFHYCIHSPIQI